MAEEKKPDEQIVVKIPLRTILISLLWTLALSFLFFVAGPADLARAWFDSRATLILAEAKKRAIEIVGTENYFRRCDHE